MGVIGTSFFLCKVAFGNSVTLAWDANAESDLVGYKIYYNSVSLNSPFDGIGIRQGASPITVELQNLSAPKNPSYELNGLSPGQTYFFKLTAYNSSGVESSFSNAVSFNVPEPAAAFHKITSSKLGNGSITPSGEVEVTEGNNLSFVIAPESHHHISDVLVDGKSVGRVTSYSFNNISENHSIEAIFTKKPEELSKEDGQSTTDSNHAILDDYVYVMDYFGLHIFDVSNPKIPIKRGNVDVGYVNGLAISGNYAYMAVDYCLQVADVSEAENPVIVSSLDMPDWTTGVAVSGNYTYAVGFFGLQIIDIQDPRSPVVIGSLDTNTANHITVLDNYAYIADDSGLQIVDISSPNSPIISSNINAGWVSYTKISNNHAYLAVTYGLEIYDIANPKNPVFIGFAEAYWANQVEVSGYYAYLATDDGLQIIDISNPSNPVSVSSIDTEDFAYSVALSGNYAYVAAGYSGLLLINASDPTNPIVDASVDGLGDARFVTAYGNF